MSYVKTSLGAWCLKMDSAIQILRMIADKYETDLQALMKTNGLTIAEFRLIDLISQEFDTQDKLSEETKLDTSTLSRQLKKIVEKDMVEKVPTGADKRQLIYTVKDQGKKALKEIKTKEQKLNKVALSNLSENEIKKLVELLNKLK